MTSPAMATRTNVFSILVPALVGVAALLGIYLVVPSVNSCTERVPLEVNSSTEKVNLLTELAQVYNTTPRPGVAKCASVSVHGTTSGQAKDWLAEGWGVHSGAVPQPQVWTPSTSLWANVPADSGQLPAWKSSGPVTSSVLAIAMPKPVADSLNLDKQKYTWADLYGRATDPRARFRIVRDNPHISSSGLIATLASYHAAALANHDSGITASTLDNANVLGFVRGIESSVPFYGEDAVPFMVDLFRQAQNAAPGDPPLFSALVVQEQLAYLYNKGVPDADTSKLAGHPTPPKDPLVTAYPADGTMKFDHPYYVLPTASSDQQKAAQDFFDFLREPSQQQRFAELGFRKLDASPTPPLSKALGPLSGQQPEFVEPAPDLIGRTLKSWDAARKKARVLLILDVSGSMGEPANPKDPNNRTKLDLLKHAAGRGLGLLSNEDEVGLWTFSDEHKEEVPVSRLADARTSLNSVINNLRSGGETALFRTAQDAHTMMTRDRDPTRVNAVVLMTDGEDNDPGHKMDISAVLNTIQANRGEGVPVPIFTIPYGKGEEHVKQLAQIAETSHAIKYDANEPPDIEQAFVAAFSNFGNFGP